MYWSGELVIHHKINNRKVYDFASRTLPHALLSTSDPHESEEQYHDWYVLRRIGGIGLIWNKAGDAWLGMSAIKSVDRKAALSRLLVDRKVVEVRVEGITLPTYIRSEDFEILERSLEPRSSKTRAIILAPLDNLLWDRRFVETLFGFHYRWEVYKPAADRQYGYYVLPILYGDRFVARFEPGHDKQKGILIIKNWWWETGVRQTVKMRKEIRRTIKQFLHFLGADTLLVESRARDRENLDWLLS
jgi:uncharacterized protein YcaQ